MRGVSIAPGQQEPLGYRSLFCSLSICGWRRRHYSSPGSLGTKIEPTSIDADSGRAKQTATLLANESMTHAPGDWAAKTVNCPVRPGEPADSRSKAHRGRPRSLGPAGSRPVSSSVSGQARISRGKRKALTSIPADQGPSLVAGRGFEPLTSGL